MAVLEDGSFAISRLSGQGGIELIFFSPAGSVVKKRFVPLAAGAAGPFSGGIGAFGDRYFFNWSRLPSGKAHAAFYSREGNRLGKIFPWPFSESTVPYVHHRYAPGQTGRVLPFFFFESGRDRFGRPIYAERSQVFGPGGFWGAEVDLVLPRYQLRVFDAAITEQGRFAVLFHRCLKSDIFESRCKVGVQRFAGDWRPRSAFQVDGYPSPDEARIFKLALARAGVHAATWIRENGPPGADDRLQVRLFHPDGRPAGEVLQLSDPAVGGVGEPEPRATFANTFVVAWRGRPGGNKLDVHIRELDGQTGQLGETIRIADDVKPFAWDFQLNSSGHGVVMWGDRVTLVTVVPDEEIHNEK
ncbi:MAG TPA: hypothetical protein DD490_03040 [Acidobacteria bacterium]|nr:hypothetical protein [Acidobacteriota bacterium]